MGTAPTDRQYPAMPDPALMVRRSVGVLRHLGVPEQLALAIIVDVTDRTWTLAAEASPEFRPWLQRVARVAIDRQRSLAESQTDVGRTDHANW